MPRLIRRILTIVYGLGIVGALSFGASQAFGRAVYLTCMYDPPTALGACINGDVGECTDRCRVFNPEAQGHCLGADCCLCTW